MDSTLEGELVLRDGSDAPRAWQLLSAAAPTSSRARLLVALMLKHGIGTSTLWVGWLVGWG